MQFNVLKSEIQSDTNDSSTRTATRIESWINDGVRIICAKRKWSFLRVQESDETSLTASDMPLLFTLLEKNSVAVPAKFITNVYDVTDGVRIEVPKTSFESLLNSDTTNTTDGVPMYWYETNDAPTFTKSIQFFPKLSTSARDFVFSFVKSVPTYTSTEEIVIPEEYITVLKDYVYWRMYMYKSDDRAGAHRDSYLDGLAGMIRDLSVYSEMANGVGRTIDRFYNGVAIP